MISHGGTKLTLTPWLLSFASIALRADLLASTITARRCCCILSWICIGAVRVWSRQQSRRRSLRLTALPTSPIRRAFLGGSRRVSKPGSEVCGGKLHLHPFRSKKGDPVRPSEHSVCAQGNQMLIGFIHKSKRMPRKGGVCRGKADNRGPS